MQVFKIVLYNEVIIHLFSHCGTGTQMKRISKMSGFGLFVCEFRRSAIRVLNCFTFEHNLLNCRMVRLISKQNI